MKELTDYLKKDQVDQMLAAAKTCNARDYLIIRLLWRTGLRVSELVSIEPRHIEFESHMITVTRTKGGRQRRIPIDGETLKMLSDYICNSNAPQEHVVFGIKRWQVHAIIKKYGRMIGVDIHPHTLRHSFAINLIRNGVDLRRLQLLLGHQSIATTQIYLQFDDKDIRAAYDTVAF
jgi:integrase/recombinase XerD